MYEEMLDFAVDTENLLAKIKPLFPDVEIGITGFARVGLDEMNSIGIYTILLSIASLLLIYILLARSFRSWVLPVITLLPLLIGVFWTMGLSYNCFCFALEARTAATLLIPALKYQLPKMLI